MVDPTGFEPMTFWNYTQGMLLGLMYTTRTLFNQVLCLTELRAPKGKDGFRRFYPYFIVHTH